MEFSARHYLLFSSTNYSLQYDFSVLTKASVLEDTLKIQLQTDLYDNKILVNGVLDDKKIACVINLDDNNFIMSEQEYNMQWNNMKVFENKKIYSKVMHIR